MSGFHKITNRMSGLMEIGHVWTSQDRVMCIWFDGNWVCLVSEKREIVCRV